VTPGDSASKTASAAYTGAACPQQPGVFSKTGEKTNRTRGGDSQLVLPKRGREGRRSMRACPGNAQQRRYRKRVFKRVAGATCRGTLPALRQVRSAVSGAAKGWEEGSSERGCFGGWDGVWSRIEKTFLCELGSKTNISGLVHEPRHQLLSL
jgi:hypothetical protein